MRNVDLGGGVRQRVRRAARGTAVSALILAAVAAGADHMSSSRCMAP